MDQILHSYSAPNAEMQDKIKLLVLVFLQREDDKTIKDFEILNNILTKLKATGILENDWKMVLELLKQIRTIPDNGKELVLECLETCFENHVAQKKPNKESDKLLTFQRKIMKTCVDIPQVYDNLTINDVLILLNCKLAIPEAFSEFQEKFCKTVADEVKCTPDVSVIDSTNSIGAVTNVYPAPNDNTVAPKEVVPVVEHPAVVCASVWG